MATEVGGGPHLMLMAGGGELRYGGSVGSV
eukprot:SAG31_NODE_22312_length_528_cov_1.328671_1_plen_29_part_10